MLEPRCGPMTGAESYSLPSQSISPPMSESDLPQPLVTRNPSDTLMRWPSTPTPTKTTPTRQVLQKQPQNSTLFASLLLGEL